jgi:hypothetical protein
MEEISTQDIIQCAGVSEEEFYSEFQQKADLLFTLAELFDQKYAELMLELSPHISHYEKLLFLNRELFRMIEQEVPVSLLSLAYSSQINADGQKRLISKDRLYYTLVRQIVEEGCHQGEFRTNESPEVMVEAYAQLERGMLYDWCVKDGSYGLTDYSQKLLPVYLKAYIR